MFAGVSLLNEVSAQMVAPLIPILIGSVLAAGPIALGAVEGAADAVAAFLKLWSGRHADVRPDKRKTMVLLGYGLALAARPLMSLATQWWMVAVLRSADRLGKGLRGAPRDAILADATAHNQRGRAYSLNRGMDYAGAVAGSLVAAAAIAWWDASVPQVILLSVLPGVAVLVLLALLPAPRVAIEAQGASRSEQQPLRWRGLPGSLRTYVKVLALFMFARASEAFILLRGQELGLGVVTLLLMWAWLAALQTVTALAAGPIIDRISKRSLTLLNWVSLSAGYAGLAMATSGTSLWIAVSVYGLLSGVSEGVERSLVSELAVPGERGTAFGWYYMVTGIAAIPSALLFGLIWKLAGPAAAFGMAASVALASAGWLHASLKPAGMPARTGT